MNPEIPYRQNQNGIYNIGGYDVVISTDTMRFQNLGPSQINPGWDRISLPIKPITKAGFYPDDSSLFYARRGLLDKSMLLKLAVAREQGLPPLDVIWPDPNLHIALVPHNREWDKTLEAAVLESFNYNCRQPHHAAGLFDNFGPSLSLLGFVRP